jgi:uncharacterized protein (TIGR03086 family)
VVGDEPVRAWERAGADARRAWTEPGATERSVHVSMGLIPATDYGWQMVGDLAVHGWDLATAIGTRHPIGEPLAQRLLREMEPQVEQFQGLGIFDAPVPVPAEADAADRLVALLGRRPR